MIIRCRNVCESMRDCADRTRLTGRRFSRVFFEMMRMRALLGPRRILNALPKGGVPRPFFIARLPFVIALLAVGACAPGLSPAPPPSPVPAPVPTPTPPPARAPEPAPRVARFRLPLVMPSTVYGVRLRAELERDSAGRKERSTVENSARIEFTLRRDARGALRGVGRVDSFTVSASGGAMRSASGTTSPATPAAPPFTNVVLDAVLDSTLVRAVVRPALANECDRPEAAAADLARDLLVRIPESVSVGDRWRDSLVTLVCRGGVPITVRTIIESMVAGTNDNDRTLRIHRSLTVRLEGSSRMPWRQTELEGDGTGTQDVLVDVATGTITQLDGESTLTLRIANGSLRDPARVQQVQQKVTLSARRLTN